MSTESVRSARCTAGSCSHTSSNPPSSYDSLSVAAKNVVGVGAGKVCTIQTISELGISQDFTHINFELLHVTA